MATTTPNFGWPVPTSTDLVKDGAVAIEGLGDAIDASLLDLKGGTTGQVLAKASNTDMDFTWATDASGIPATIFDAKGDIIAATAADTASRLAVGANNTVLTADSSTATGLKWATPASGSTYVGCSVSNSGSQSIANTTETAITYDTEQWDTDAIHSTATNTSRFTVPTGKGGKWHLSTSINTTGAGAIWEFYIYKNGSYFITGFPQFSITQNGRGTAQGIVSFELDLVATDYIQIYVWQNSGSTENIRMQYGRVFFSYIGA